MVIRLGLGGGPLTGARLGRRSIASWAALDLRRHALPTPARELRASGGAAWAPRSAAARADVVSGDQGRATARRGAAAGWTPGDRPRRRRAAAAPAHGATRSTCSSPLARCPRSSRGSGVVKASIPRAQNDRAPSWATPRPRAARSRDGSRWPGLRRAQVLARRSRPANESSRPAAASGQGVSPGARSPDARGGSRNAQARRRRGSTGRTSTRLGLDPAPCPGTSSRSVLSAPRVTTIAAGTFGDAARAPRLVLRGPLPDDPSPRAR